MGARADRQFFISRALLTDFVVLFAYLLVSLVLTYPLVLDFGRVLLGADDASSHVWMGWWFNRALFVDHQSPLNWSNYLYYPDGFRLGASYDGLLFPLFSLVSQFFTDNLFLIYNLYCLLALSFSAWATYLLVRRLTNRRPISFLGGLAVGFAPYQLAHALGGHSNLISFGFVPLFFLSLLELLDAPSIRKSLKSSFLLFCVGLGSWNYLLFTLLSLLFFLLHRFWTVYRKTPRNYLSWLRRSRIYMMFVIAALLLVPFFLPLLRGIISGEVVVPEGSSIIYGSADLTSYLVPPPQSALGKLFSTSAIFDRYLDFNDTESSTYVGSLEIGLLTLVLLLLGFKRVRGKVWLLLAIFCFLLSLGVSLRVVGKSYGVLPYWLLTKLPFGTLSRVPARLSIFVLLFLTTFLCINGYRLYSLLKPRFRALVWGLLLAALLGERLFLPMRTSVPPVSPFYEVMRQDGGEYAVVNLPLFDSQDRNALSNFTQTIHEKKTVGGYISTFSLTTQVGRFIMKNPAIYHSFCPSFTREKADNILSLQPSGVLFQTLSEEKVRYLILQKGLLDSPDCILYKSFINYYLQDFSPYYEDAILRVYLTTK